MKIHEYQAKEIFRKFGVPTPRGEMVTTPEQARAVAEKLGTKIVVVKAQIHAGGRGKAGGVKLAKSPAEAADLAKAMMCNDCWLRRGWTSSANSTSASWLIALSPPP
jgi:succinyl-CoA synthetase beta subunit